MRSQIAAAASAHGLTVPVSDGVARAAPGSAAGSRCRRAGRRRAACRCAPGARTTSSTSSSIWNARPSRSPKLPSGRRQLGPPAEQRSQPAGGLEQARRLQPAALEVALGRDVLVSRRRRAASARRARAPTKPSRAPAPRPRSRWPPARRTRARTAGRRSRWRRARPASANTVGRPRRSSARVEHVVVHQRGHVEQLHRRARRHEPLVVALAAEEHQHRPQPLAARRQRAGGVRAQLGAVALGHLGQPALGALEQTRPAPVRPPTAPRRAAPARCSHVGFPAWIAMMPPAVRIQRTSSSPAAAIRAASSSGSGEAPHAARQVGVGVGVAGQAARAPAPRVSNHALKNHDSGGFCGVVISSTTTRPPGFVTRAISREAAIEVGEVAGAEADRRPRRTRRRDGGARARRPPRRSGRAPSRGRSRASPARSPCP